MKLRVLMCAAVIAACGKSSGSGGGGGNSSASGAAAASSGGSSASAGGASAGSASAPAAADGPQDRCEVHVTGADPTSWIGTRPRSDEHAGGGKVMAQTDYWLTDDELHQALSTMAGALSKKSKEEIEQDVAAAMKKDPRFMLLMINCGVEDKGFLMLAPANGAHYADVPFKPGTYRIVDKDQKPGDFGVMFNLAGKHELYRPSEPGKIELTKFDTSGIAGTFHFVATNYKGDKTVTVDGNFDYGCRAGSRCK